MTSFILLTFSWSHFALISSLACFGWIAWTFKDEILGKGPPPSTSGAKRIWTVEEKKPQTSNQIPAIATADDNLENNLDEGDEDMTDEDDEFLRMEKMIIAIENLVSDHKATPEKELLIAALQPLFLSNESLKVNPFRLAIHNYLSKISLKELGIAFTDQEMNQLWIA
ncbi:hypothetical protein WJU16_02785 [Chitinophaga pollutisoli]|uniref:Uncharacterized protein n=1 Tax=Chitinophaga pollutisoli TaxID=3133966 RepID=A0ABZ2YQB4_9BACT